MTRKIFLGDEWHPARVQKLSNVEVLSVKGKKKKKVMWKGPQQSAETTGLLTDVLINSDGLFSLQTHNQEIKSYINIPKFVISCWYSFKESSFGRK